MKATAGWRRYARLLRVQWRMSLLLSMQYRADFIVEGVISLFVTATALVPLFVVFGDRAAIAGWSFGEALIVTGFFTLLGGVLEGAINPSLEIVVEHIRKGTLDLVLVKPADAQFLVSTAKFQPWKVMDLPVSFAIFAYAFHRLGRTPALVDVAGALLMLVAATLVLYSLWILVVSAAFWVVRLDNLAYLFMSIFDFARWPVSIFKGTLRLFFTAVIPLALMTTYPALVLLGKLAPSVGLAVVGGAITFAVLARLVWVRAVGRYTSASS